MLPAGDCETFRPIDEVLTVRANDYAYFASDDSQLSSEECEALCMCLAPNPWLAKEAARGGYQPNCKRQADDPSTHWEACEDRGMEGTEHLVYCKGEEGDRIVCGRDSACNLFLGRGGGQTPVARWLAFAAATEAASVASFLTLARDLAALRAPSSLIRRARHAAADEVRHTRWMSRLAHSRGGRVHWPRSTRIPVRDLESVAAENAVEGLVHETWAALLNQHQAVHAAERDIRDIMVRIAADETVHAELARDIHTWALTQLPEVSRQHIDTAKRAAAATLRRSQREHPASLRQELGLPSQRTRQWFTEKLSAGLWA